MTGRVLPGVMGVPARREGADPSERASDLRIADAAVMLGPRLTPDGREWRIPSPDCNEAAVARWRAMGGRFEKRGLVSFWFVPAGSAKVEELDRMYREFYPGQARSASMRLAMADPDLHRKVKRAVEKRAGG